MMQVSVKEIAERNSQWRKDFLKKQKSESKRAVVDLTETSKYLSYQDMKVRVRFISQEVKRVVLLIEGYERKYRRSTKDHLMLVEDKCFEGVSETELDWYYKALWLKREGIL